MEFFVCQSITDSLVNVTLEPELEWFISIGRSFGSQILCQTQNMGGGHEFRCLKFHR
jgi:hypothetical protein